MNCLVFLSGPEPGRTVELSPGQKAIHLGRGAECEVSLADEQASRIHSVLTYDGSQWRIEDQASLNGTFVNSRRVQRSVLRSGDLIRVGESMLVFSQPHDTNHRAMDPSYFSDATRVRRILGPDKERVANELADPEVTTGPLRKLAFLYRLSREIHSAETVESLLGDTLTAIQQVIQADDARVVLRTNAGRLKRYSTAPKGTQDNSHVLSNWVMETDEALLLDIDKDASWRRPGEPLEQGNAIGVPIPGRSGCIGAIECFHPLQETSFEVADLHFLVAVGQHIGLAIETLNQHERVKRRNEQLQNQLGETRSKFIGDSHPVRQMRTQIARVAKTDVTTLVLGESGTGKEVVSQLIHQLSDRKDGPFVAVNCAAFSDSLLESELFGHEKGAFTGADALRQGQFELAHGGTIFLDEVGELSSNCQAKLLRLLEGQPFTRVGGTEPIETNVRIVAATHRNLNEMVQSGEFRDDLWYRLRVVELCMPPLRTRGDDILLLADYFFEKLRREMGHGPSRISDAASEALLAHRWPGNVRELRNSIERALVLAVGDEIEPNDLGMISHPGPPAPSAPQHKRSIAEVERLHVEVVLDSVGGNKTHACEILGITRASLYNKLKRYSQLESDSESTPK